jgi:hypothetical protein
MKKIIQIILLLSLFSLSSYSHSGRTDKNSGHYNRKTGEYHYHDKSSDWTWAFIIVGGVIVYAIVNRKNKD